MVQPIFEHSVNHPLVFFFSRKLFGTELGSFACFLKSFFTFSRLADYSAELLMFLLSPKFLSGLFCGCCVGFAMLMWNWFVCVGRDHKGIHLI